MATLIPRIIPETSPKSERRVHRALGDLSQDWTALHSVKWQSRRNGRPGDGEADFVLIHPRRGILVLEVKGGEVSVEAGTWYTGNSRLESGSTASKV